jgi:predicted GH43/DUF377 family glycosyl hydrolase
MKHGGPVLSPSRGHTGVHGPSVLYYKDKWHMWVAQNTKPKSIGHDVSSDGFKWTHLGVALEATPKEGLYQRPDDEWVYEEHWDTLEVGHPTVIEHDGGLMMWYSSRTQIGLATSTDGNKWTKYSGNPIVSGASGSWTEGGVMRPFVLYEHGLFKMWFTGIETGNFRIGLATSKDGKDWTEHHSNPVFSGGGPVGDVSAASSVVHNANGTYNMWYEGLDETGDSHISHAISLDGISWFPTHYPVITKGQSDEWPYSWDNFDVQQPCIVAMPSEYRLYYTASDGKIIRIGLATAPRH